MRYLLLTIILLPLSLFGQSFLPTGSVTQGTYQRGGYGADSVLSIPVGDTIPRFINYRNIGRVMVNKTDSGFYYHNGTKWVNILAAGDTLEGLYILNQTDTIQSGGYYVKQAQVDSTLLVGKPSLTNGFGKGILIRSGTDFGAYPSFRDRLLSIGVNSAVSGASLADRIVHIGSAFMPNLFSVSAGGVNIGDTTDAGGLLNMVWGTPGVDNDYGHSQSLLLWNRSVSTIGMRLGTAVTGLGSSLGRNKVIFYIRPPHTGINRWSMVIDSNNNFSIDSINTDPLVKFRVKGRSFSDTVQTRRQEINVGSNTNALEIRAANATPATDVTDALIHTQSNAANDYIQDRASSNTLGAYWQPRKARGTLNAPLTVANADELGGWLAWGHDGIAYRNSASIKPKVNGTVATNSVPSLWEISTTDAGGTSSAVALTVTNAATNATRRFTAPAVITDSILASGGTINTTSILQTNNNLILRSDGINSYRTQLIFRGDAAALGSNTFRMGYTSAGSASFNFLQDATTAGMSFTNANTAQPITFNGVVRFGTAPTPQTNFDSTQYKVSIRAGSNGNMVTSEPVGVYGYIRQYIEPTVTVSSAATLSLNYFTDYVFTGTTTTWTLPSISASIVGRRNAIWVKNRGTGNITINTNAGLNTLYTTTATNTMTILPGEAYIFNPDGTFINLQ